ncbi:GNAT family N-acetyltransferase [Nocardia sp. NPDC003482]
MTATHPHRIRTTTEPDLPHIRELMDVTYGGRHPDSVFNALWENFALGESLVADSDGTVDGNVTVGRFTVTVPGGQQLQAAGLTAVAVNPLHQRKGIMRALLDEVDRRSRTARVPLTILMSSQGGIYGRFGYGPSTRKFEISIDRATARWLSTTPNPGGARFVTMAEASKLIPAIYDRWRRQTPAAQARPESAWGGFFDNPTHPLHGGSGSFALVHDDGYALYNCHWGEPNARTGAIRVQELRYLTADAHAALWRALLALDGLSRVTASLPFDDPLPYLLVDPRLVQVAATRDALWTRITDIPTALRARVYRCDLDVVLRVHDPFRNTDSSVRLVADHDGAQCHPTTRAPDVDLGLDVLGSLYFGAHRARTFAAANRLRARTETILDTVDLAFSTVTEPVLGWNF